jgi:hypothetical protein
MIRSSFLGHNPGLLVRFPPGLMWGRTPPEAKRTD